MIRKHKLILISAFLAILVLPNIFMYLKLNDVIYLNEKKASSKLPAFSTNIANMAKESRSYYLNNFGYKNISFVIYSFFKTQILQELPLVNKVVRGKQGWLYLGDFGKNVFSNNVGVKTIKPVEGISLKNNIGAYFKNSSSLGIPFYMIVCPDKHQIYDEYLPFKLPKAISKYEEVLEKMKSEGVNLILLKDEFLNVKKENKIYHKTDSHWNDLGAFYGFNSLVGKLQQDFPSLKKIEKNQFNKTIKIVKQQDLTQMININILEEVEVLTPKIKSYNQNTSLIKGVRVNRLVNSSKKLKVIVFHDSYSYALMKYFGLSFGESVFVKSFPDYNLIKKEQPDIVILQMVNRKLETLCTEEIF